MYIIYINVYRPTKIGFNLKTLYKTSKKLLCMELINRILNIKIKLFSFAKNMKWLFTSNYLYV